MTDTNTELRHAAQEHERQRQQRIVQMGWTYVSDNRCPHLGIRVEPANFVTAGWRPAFSLVNDDECPGDGYSPRLYPGDSARHRGIVLNENGTYAWFDIGAVSAACQAGLSPGRLEPRTWLVRVPGLR